MNRSRSGGLQERRFSLVSRMFPDPHQPRSPFDPAPHAPRRVKPAHLAAIAAVGVAALGLMGLKFVSLPDTAAVAPGDGLKIEIVAPVEPPPVPGSVMEVGELVDGFRYVPPPPVQRAAVYEAAWTGDEDFAPYEPPSRPAAVRRYTSAEPEASPPSEPEPPRRERDRRWFGFDNPLPDFGAERRARQARLDALEAQRRTAFEERRRYSSDPAPQPAADESDEGPWGPEVG